MDAKVAKGEAQLLDERWGHCSWKTMSQLLKRFCNPRINPEDKCFCAPCVQAKSHAKTTKYSPGPLDVIIADGVGHARHQYKWSTVLGAYPLHLDALQLGSLRQEESRVPGEIHRMARLYHHTSEATC